MDATPLIGLVIAPLICVIWLLYLWGRPERRDPRHGENPGDSHPGSPDARS
jgi:hypothetical protein